MPLSSAQPRQPIHTRRIVCDAYRRQDGLIDVEGHITDIRPFPYHNHWDQSVVDGTPIHEMRMRLTINADKRIEAVEVSFDNIPFPHCAGSTDHYQRLVGLTISAGMGRQVMEKVGGVEGCTHLTGMIQILATTLFQALASEVQRVLPNPEGKSAEQLHLERTDRLNAVFAGGADPDYPLLNTCFSHSDGSPVVEVFAPRFHKRK